jgi:NhaP-type Na+/H+ and K+/H+ antiporter
MRQVVIWFSGLRGAIAFALAQNMPGPRADLYTTTTLCVCIVTTVVCGGLTEPILERMSMKVPAKGSELELPITADVRSHGAHGLSSSHVVVQGPWMKRMIGKAAPQDQERPVIDR